MRTRIKNIEECTKLFQIEIPRETVEKVTEEVYQEIKKIAKIPGFRPGAVPRDLLEKHYSQDAQKEILKRLIPSGYKQAVQDYNVDPIAMPEISNINFQKDKPFTFEAKVDVRPALRLKNYKGIKVDKKRISVSQQEIDDTMNKLRDMSAKYENVERPVKKDDYAICDIEAFIDGKPVAKKNTGAWVQVNKDASLLGMGEELVGLNNGQEKEVTATLPPDYPDKKYAGKKAQFKILVKEIKEKRLPELNDDFAKNMKAENMSDLRKEIESQLFTRKENALKINMENQILLKLLKDNKFNVPSSLVSRQKEVLAKRLENELTQKGLPKEETDKKIKELGPKLEADAFNKVRIYFMLDEIASKENIKVNEEDIEERIKTVALSVGRPAEEIKSYYEKENLMGGLAEEIREAKVLDFLLKEAEINEVDGK